MKLLITLACVLSMQGAPSTTKTPAPSTVYVTAKGGKYHTHKDCRYLKGKEVKAITIKQAESQEKTLCKVCQVKDLLKK